MSITQIIILTIIGIIIIVCYFGTAYAEKLSSKLGFITLWMFTSVFALIIAVIMTQQRNELYKQLQKGCPQYEKIEAYRLKP